MSISKGAFPTIQELLGSAPWLLIAALGLPAALTGFFIRRMEKRIDAREEERKAEQKAAEERADERAKKREQLDIVMINAINGAIALSEATARAVQRIPDAHCNGDMHKALDYAAKVKHEQKNLLMGLGIHALHDDD